MKKIELPGRFSVYTLNHIEARVLYHEIFTDASYLKHGIELKRDDCIFDVGANIGMFALYANKICPGMKLYAFEPVREIFRVLQKNVSDHIQHTDVQLFNMGLSDKNTVAVFQYNTRLSMAAGMYAAELRKNNQKNIPLSEWMYALLRDYIKANGTNSRLLVKLQSGLQISFLKQILALLLVIPFFLYLLFLRFTTKKTDCTLQTLASVIRNNVITKIDLCKIDVEGSEWDVLMGIEEDQWPLFRQFVIEVHDLDGRVEKIRTLLQTKGFRVHVERENWELHRLMNIYTVFASRKLESHVHSSNINL